MKHASIAALLIVALSAGSAAADDKSTCFNANTRPEEAISVCSRFIGSNTATGSELSAAHAWRAVAHNSKGNLDQALSDWNEAVRRNPQNVNHLANRGDFLARKRDYDGAIADYQEAIRISPKLARNHNALSFALNQKRDYDRGIAAASTAIALDPQSASARINRAFAHNQKLDYDRAIEDTSEAIRLSPKSALAHMHRGFAYKQKREFDRALADLGTSLKLDPKLAISYAFLGDVYNNKRDYGRAIIEHGEAIKLDANLVAARYGRGYAFNQMGETAKALEDFNEAIRLNPKHAIALSARAVLRARKGEFELALTDADESVRIDPKNAALYNNRGLVLNLKGDFDRALTDLAESMRLASNSAAAFKNRGLTFEGKGEFEKALADFRTALTLDFRAGGRAELEAVEGAKRVEEKLAALGRNVPPKPLAGGEKRVALVIGNGNYRHADRLPNPTNDALDIAGSLRRLGFEVVEGHDLDRRAMEDKVREFGRKLDGAGLALFFYAGHGMQVNGKNYLLATDSKLDRPADLTFETIDVSLVLAQMEAEQRVNLVFLDACRNNPLARSLSRTLGSRSANVGSGLAGIQGAVGTMIAYATQPDSEAADGDGRNSPFTRALLKHIAAPKLDISAVMRRVRAEVISATRGKQVPWDHSSLIGDVVLAR